MLSFLVLINAFLEISWGYLKTFTRVFKYFSFRSTFLGGRTSCVRLMHLLRIWYIWSPSSFAVVSRGLWVSMDLMKVRRSDFRTRVGMISML